MCESVFLSAALALAGAAMAGYDEEDYVIVGEGLKDVYLCLAAKMRPDGGREVYVSGLDISGTTPESASLRANLLRWLVGARSEVEL